MPWHAGAALVLEELGEEAEEAGETGEAAAETRSATTEPEPEPEPEGPGRAPAPALRGPARAEALTAEALGHFTANEHQRARAAVDRALELDPSNRRARELRRILRFLG